MRPADPEYSVGHQQVPRETEHPPSTLPTYRDLAAKNTVGTVPEWVVAASPVDYGTDGVPVDRYLSPEFHILEVERMWRRTWQFACFEDDIPEVGDYVPYEIAGISIIVARSAADRISAFYNACLHKAAALCNGPGHADELRCRYHGWTYQLDGTLTWVPASWDVPQVCPGRDRITPVQVATWDGFVFVNMDPQAPPLEQALHPLADHFAKWPYTGRHRSVWVKKVVPVNWKAAQEAFIEGYHLASTHEQVVNTIWGYEMQYDVLGPNVTRIVSAMAAPNWITGPDISEQELLDHYTAAGGLAPMEVADGSTARSVLAASARDKLEQLHGVDLSEMSDPEVIDSPLYPVFPNVVLWGGYNVPLVYRFRPNGSDPRSSIMEIFRLDPIGKGRGQAPHVPVHELTLEQRFSEASELGWLGFIFDQDLGNLRAQQVGLRSTPMPMLQPSRVQESLCRHHVRRLDSYLLHDDDRDTL